MAKRKKGKTSGTMLELWRPPSGAGDAVGCMATTFTFQPALFDEQCLARFLEVDSEPDREDIAFLLERETRLGAVYAGVMVDHTQSGVEHSLRWDVLPVRIPRAKQHAKLSVLAWQNHVRLLVASANLTQQGYRLNQEVCVAIDSNPDEAEIDLVTQAIDFLRHLLAFVPGARTDIAEGTRACDFLNQVQEMVKSWIPTAHTKGQRQTLVFSLPATKQNNVTGETSFDGHRAMADVLSNCSRKNGAPEHVWIASPFFDVDDATDVATETLCKAMARGGSRHLDFCVPSLGDASEDFCRLAAPSSLQKTAEKYANTGFSILPQKDKDSNSRPWHAKMVSFYRQNGKAYSALMIGSSNFTRAGMGIGAIRNAEANLLTVADHLPRARLPRHIDEVWPEMVVVENLDIVEWKGATKELVEEQQALCIPVPAGFLSATYRAGDRRELILRFDADHLPNDWSIFATGQNNIALLGSEQWKHKGEKPVLTLHWEPLLPPDKILIQWVGKECVEYEAFLPLNVEDANDLPPPAELAGMSADDMLLILAASDPSGAFRAWAKKQQLEVVFDEELDAATPPDLDPLRRYELGTTFLRRVRSRARILARLRTNLQRPAWSEQALLWRLEGFIGIRPLAERVLGEVLEKEDSADEALLTLADLIILLCEVEYEPEEGSISREDFDDIYEPFLKKLITEIDSKIRSQRQGVGRDVLAFWKRVVDRCLE